MTSTRMPEVQLSRRVADRYLLRGERPVVSTRQHWASVAEPLGSAALASFLFLLAWLSGAWGQAAWILGFPAFLLLARAFWRLLEWRCIWFVTTDRRLLKTYGLITQRVAMMPLAKVTDMSYDRTILGRMLGYGEFVMESAGQDQALHTVRWIPNPDQVYRALGQTIFHDDVSDPGEDGQHWADAPYAEWRVDDRGARGQDRRGGAGEVEPWAQERDRRGGAGESEHRDRDAAPDARAEHDSRWQPVERHQLPADWEWAEPSPERPVAIDPDPTPWQ